MNNDNYRTINFPNRNRQSEKQRLSSQYAEQRFAPVRNLQIREIYNHDRYKPWVRDDSFTKNKKLMTNLSGYATAA